MVILKMLESERAVTVLRPQGLKHEKKYNLGGFIHKIIFSDDTRLTVCGFACRLACSKGLFALAMGMDQKSVPTLVDSHRPNKCNTRVQGTNKGYASKHKYFTSKIHTLLV